MENDVTEKSENLPAVHKPKAELAAGSHVAPIIPRNIDEVARIANAVIVAGLAPNSYEGNSEKETASKIMIGIMKGAEIGLAPLTALANIAIINGRASLWGDGAVALIQASGKVSKWEETYEGKEGGDDYTAICKIWRVGQELPYIGKFAWADAKRAKLVTKGPWIAYGPRMLMWRARSYAMRTGFADCLSGLGIAEEVQDLPVAPPPKPDTSDILDDDILTPATESPHEVPETALERASRLLSECKTATEVTTLRLREVENMDLDQAATFNALCDRRIQSFATPQAAE
jgi:hypothetical protein